MSFNAIRPPGRLSTGSPDGEIMLSIIGCLDHRGSCKLIRLRLGE